MASGNPQLIEAIRAEISADGPISFARFMQLALYHPEYGYYASGRATIGRAGDFFTNVSVGPAFGALIAAQFAEIWQKLDSPSRFTIVEQGAHDGTLAADVLTALSRSRSLCFERTDYVIVEPFPFWREQQRKSLGSLNQKIRWIAAMSQIEPFVGIHFSNELFDALPVHLIISATAPAGAGPWHERFVTVTSDNFEFTTAPLSDVGLRASLICIGPLPSGFQTELNLEAPKLIREITSKLMQGVILMIDYGFPRRQFYSPSRNQGTLQIRSQHRKLSSPFHQIGLADISAHVEWTSLAEAGIASGAILMGFGDQHHFLSGILSQLPADELSNVSKPALQTLLHPELLGRSFQALALGKNFPGSLSSFRFARDPRVELGIGL